MPMAFMNRTNGNIISNRNGIKIQLCLWRMAALLPRSFIKVRKKIFTQLLWAIMACQVFKNMLLGSVSNQVINPNKKCTVVIVR
jgi:hypothetical protein